MTHYLVCCIISDGPWYKKHGVLNFGAKIFLFPFLKLLLLLNEQKEPRNFKKSSNMAKIYIEKKTDMTIFGQVAIDLFQGLIPNFRYYAEPESSLIKVYIAQKL